MSIATNRVRVGASGKNAFSLDPALERCGMAV